MLTNTKTIVLPSARAIRHEQLKLQEKTLFLPNYITMGEFIAKLCIVKGFKPIDEDTRVLLLLKAADFDSFKELQIERNFFAFTKNSSYIFKFFQELAHEQYDINNLANNDIYAEYEEHIEILQELYKRYEKLCLDAQVLDAIFLPKLYEFNSAFASSHKSVSLSVDGHLTNFEFELLLKLCEYTEVELLFYTSRFNTKMQEKFTYLGFKLEVGYRYSFSLNSKSILAKERIIENKNISCISVSEPLLQVGYIKHKIYEYMQKGYRAQNIAVVLPDESMATSLKLFDEKFNFNFAMGEPYKKSIVYAKLSATLEFLEQNSKENEARMHRLGSEFYAVLAPLYYKTISQVDIEKFLQDYKESFDPQDQNEKVSLSLYEAELYKFKRILPHLGEMTTKSVLSMFMQRLSSLSIDDVRGGKITVMGVLETRSVSFDAVIIVDFNDTNVPKRSDKDMFLNTQIRKNANLPTMSDRENLQKHYYDALINASREVAISFVKSAQSRESRFLKQLGIKEKREHQESKYAKILFHSSISSKSLDDEIFATYDFKHKKLSATKLKTFLTCRRKFYLKYMLNLQGHQIPKDIPEEYEIGSHVHQALEMLYRDKKSYTDAIELKSDLDKELDKVVGTSELDKYLIALQKKRLEGFANFEVKRFAEGWHVQECEVKLETEFAGMQLVGVIDRIDAKDDAILVLDYKTGSYPLYNKKNFVDATDFQLEFYYLLTRGYAQNISCGYYDLKEIKIVQEPFLEEKIEILKSNIKDILALDEISFMKCEEIKNCLYCDYKVLCQRD